MKNFNRYKKTPQNEAFCTSEKMPQDDTIIEEVNISFNFSDSLKRARKRRGFNQFKASRVIGISRATIQRWESGEKTPCEITQETALKKLRKASDSPKAYKIKAAERKHHISWEKGRGWFMRLTISLDAKRVGKRIKFRLKTRNIEEAIKRRDVVFSAFKALGFQVTQSGLIVPKTKPKQ